MSVLVTGSTGTIGRHLVEELARAGQTVRPVVRNPVRATVLGDLASVAVVADLDDPTAVQQAVDGVDHIVLITANTSRQLQQETNVIDAARRVGVSHLIKLSVPSPSAQAPLALSRDHFHIEERLRASGVPATVVRPGFITQNLLQYAGWIEPDGRWRLPLGDGAMAMVDARDIAAAIAILVDRGASATEEQMWTGPEALNMSNAAKILSEATGRSIDYVDSDAEAFYERYVAAGNEPGYARDITTLYDEMIRAGLVAAVEPGLESLIGRPARTFAQFAADHAGKFQASPSTS